MQFGDNRGVKTGRWVSDEIFDDGDANFIGTSTYQNFTDLLGSKHRDALLASDVIDGGLILEHNNLLTCDLRAGIAVSSQGTYISSDTWGFVAEPGSLFSVFNPRDQSVAFSAGGAQDRIDTVEIRPTQTTYNTTVRRFKDPLTGEETNTPVDTRIEYGVEFAVRIGTESPSPVAPSRTAGWVKIAEVSVAAGASSITQNEIRDLRRSGEWTTNASVTRSSTEVFFEITQDSTIDLGAYVTNVTLHVTQDVSLVLNNAISTNGATVTVLTSSTGRAVISGTAGILRTAPANTYILGISDTSTMLTATLIDGTIFGLYFATIVATIKWTERQTLDGGVFALTFGNGLYVAGTENPGNSIWTSPDGITWTERQTLDGDVRTLTFGNGLYVAGTGSPGDSIWTSPDGITWTERQTLDGDVFALTFGNGLYVAGTLNPGNSIWTSPDGITWTERQTLDGGVLVLTFGNGLYVAGTENPGNSIWTSPDGITWTERQTLDGDARTLTFGNGLYVAGTENPGNSIWTSPDGITWTERQTLDAGIRAAVYGQEMFVVGTTTSGESIWTPGL